MQLRTVAKLPRHVTRVSNAELFTRLQVPPPLVLLLHINEKLCARLASAHMELPEADIMTWPQFQEQALRAKTMIQDAANHSQRLVTVDAEAGVPCPLCGIYFSSAAYVKAHITRKHPGHLKPAALPLENIRRDEISQDGMPVCRSCGRAFGAWRELLEHVRLQRCPCRMHTPEATAPAQTPLVLRVELLQTWLDGGAHVLASQIASQPGLRQELRERCCMCHQWVASHSHIKHHIRKTHPDLYKQFHDTVVADCQLLATSLSEPCPYCGLQCIQNKRKHASQCIVLYQASLSCRRHGQQHDLRGARLSLWGLPSSGPSRPKLDGPAGSEPLSHGTPCQVAKTQRERPGTWPGTQQRHETATGQPSLERWLAGPKRERPDRACPRSSPAVSSTGGLVELAEARPLVPPVLPHPRPGDHVERALWHLNSMEIPEGCRQHGVPAEDCPVQVRRPRTSLQSSSGGGGPGESCRPGEEGMAHQGRRQRTLMGSTRVGPEQPERRGGIGDGAAPAHGRLEGTGPDHGGCRRHHPSEISLHEASRPVLQRRDGPVFDGDIQPWSRSTASSSRACGTVLLSTLVPGGGTAQGGIPTSLPAGTEATEARLRQVASLALHNSRNYCYQHAFLISWIWSMIQSCCLQGRPFFDLSLAGKGASIIRKLLDTNPNRLSSMFEWTPVLQQWRRPQEQHDVGEFTVHVLSKLQPPILQGRWLARLADPMVRNVDSGVTVAPITLTIPARASNLQDCVNAWHSQAAIHALEAPVPLIVLQLGRFTGNGIRRTRKLLQRLNLNGGLQLPVFETGLAAQWCRYSVVAGVFHLGSTATSGHYRSFLNYAGAGVQSKAREHFQFPATLTTDDGRSALPILHDEAELISQNSYLIWCAKSC